MQMKLKKAAELVEAGVEESLSYTFPRGHWRHIDPPPLAAPAAGENSRSDVGEFSGSSTRGRRRRRSARQAAFSSVSSTPCFQSHSMQRSVVPLLFSFLRTNFALQIGHGCGIGLSHATKSHCFFAQFEQP